MSETPKLPKRTPWHVWILWLVALASLALNVLLVNRLLTIRTDVAAGLSEAAATLDAVAFPDLEVPVQVRDSIPFTLTVPFSDTFSVEIDEIIPISITVPFQDEIFLPINDRIDIGQGTVAIEAGTTIPVTIPVLNQQVQIPLPATTLPVPRTSVPFSVDISVPISRTIPIDTSIPIVLPVDVPVQTSFAVETEVPVRLDVPVTVPVADLGLESILNEIASALRALAEAFE